MLIEHIDAIARQKQRDVLYVTFKSASANQADPDTDTDEESVANESDDWLVFDWENDPTRQAVCQWLTEQNIPWQYCAQVADENFMCGYQGQIYVDVPFDDNDPQYLKLREYLEYPNGSMRFATVGFYYLPLEKAMENAHHDEPGFWEKWAENF
jgi:hypothetical protein